MMAQVPSVTILDLSSSLRLWHYEVVLCFGVAEPFSVSAFCEWVEERVACERASSLALGQSLLNGFYLRLASGNSRVPLCEESTTLKAMGILLDNPFRLQQIGVALETSSELLSLVLEVGCTNNLQMDLCTTLLHFLVCSSASMSQGFKAIQDCYNTLLGHRQRQITSDQRTLLVRAVWSVVVPDLWCHVSEIAIAVAKEVQFFELSSSQVCSTDGRNQLLARANLLNTMSLWTKLAEMMASDLMRCTDAGLTLLEWVGKRASPDNEAMVTTFHTIVGDAWDSGAATIGGQSLAPVSWLGRALVTTLCADYSSLSDSPVARIVKEAYGRDQGDVELISARLKGPRVVITSVLQGDRSQDTALLTSRRAVQPTIDLAAGPTLNHALRNLISAMVEHGDALLALEEDLSFKGVIIGAARIHAVLHTVALEGAFQKHKKRISSQPTSHSNDSVAHRSRKSRQRVPRERASSSPQLLFASLRGRRKSIDQQQRLFSSSSSSMLMSLDPVRGSWNQPWCVHCSRSAVPFENDHCSFCKRKLDHTGAAFPLLLRLLADRLYEVGSHRIQGDVRHLLLPSSELFIQWCPVVGPQLLELTLGTSPSLLLYTAIGPDRTEESRAQDCVVCVLQQASSGAEMFFVLSVCAGFTRYQRPPSRPGAVPAELVAKTLVPVLDTKLVERFRQFVGHTAQLNFKFGLLYQRQDQDSEASIYGNSQGSAQYDDFLDLLGERISLALHSGYTGGLARSDEFSVFRQMRIHPRSGRVFPTSEDTTASDHTGIVLNVMWHVATLMHQAEDTTEFLHRKRHIGNDVVVVVFRDYGTSTPFTPNFRSHFNHVYIVVQPAALSNAGVATSFLVQVAAKQGVPPFQPFVPCLPLHRPILRHHLGDFLTAKCVNGETSTMQAPAFARRLAGVRAHFIEQFVKDSTCRP